MNTSFFNLLFFTIFMLDAENNGILGVTIGPASSSSNHDDGHVELTSGTFDNIGQEESQHSAKQQEVFPQLGLWEKRAAQVAVCAITGEYAKNCDDRKKKKNEDECVGVDCAAKVLFADYFKQKSEAECKLGAVGDCLPTCRNLCKTDHCDFSDTIGHRLAANLCYRRIETCLVKCALGAKAYRRMEKEWEKRILVISEKLLEAERLARQHAGEADHADAEHRSGVEEHADAEHHADVEPNSEAEHHAEDK